MKYRDTVPSTMIKDQSVVWNGLKVIPNVISFTMSLSGEPLVAKVSFQNISTRLIRFKISRPYSSAFTLKGSESSHMLGPGMRTTKEILFSNTDNTVSDTSIPVKINTKNFSLPIIVNRMKSNLVISPSRLDFGVINIGGQLSVRKLQIKNIGDCTGKFLIDLNSTEIMLTAEPKSGRIKPGNSVDVSIKVCGINPGNFDNEFWVASETSSRIILSVTTISPALKVHHLTQTGEYIIVDFKRTYFRTCAFETFLVHNYSALTTTYVVLLEEKSQFQSLGFIHSYSNKFDWIMMNPEEGKLSPFEAKVFTARFSPLCQSKRTSEEQEYWAILKVVRVDVKEITPSESEKQGILYGIAKFSMDNQPIHNTEDISICVYGKAEEADIILEPDVIHISLENNTVSRKCLFIQNKSKYLPVEYEYVKIPNLDIEPPKKELGPGETVEVCLTFFARFGYSPPRDLTFNVNSFFDLTHKEKPITLKKKKLLLEIEITMSTSGGYTIISEKSTVHVMKSFSTIDKNTCPRLQRCLLRKTGNKQNLHTCYDERKDPGRSVTSSHSSFMKSSQRDTISSSQESRRHVKISPNVLQYANLFDCGPDEYDVTDDKLYLLLGMRKPILEALAPYIKKKEKIMGHTNVTMPLSPTHLYNVTFLPKELRYGQVPLHKECPLAVTVENLNFFPITIKLWTNPELKVHKDHLTVEANSSITTEIFLILKNIGKYFTNLGYAINEKHTFYKRVTAEGVSGALEVTPSSIFFKSPDVNSFIPITYAPVTIKNPYMVPMFFSWKIFSRLDLEVIPISGTLKPLGFIKCLIYLQSYPNKKVVSELLLKIERGNREERVKCSVTPFTIKYEVILLKKLLQLGFLAIGTTYKKKVYLFNNGFTSARYYLTLDPPVEGVVINPKIGVISPKSLEALTLNFYFDYLLHLDTYLLIKVENLYALKLHITGRVVFPEVKFSPNAINLKQVPCLSFSTVPIKVTNISKAEVKLEFRMIPYPQCKISTSDNFLHPAIGAEGILLMPEGYCTIYLHFAPYQVTVDNFLLPVVLNTLIGPPEINNRDSQFPKYFIKYSLTKEKRINNPLCVPDSMSLVNVSLFVLKRDFEFSQLKYHFFAMEKTCNYKERFKVVNCMDSSVMIGFNLKNLSKTPFTFVPVSSKEIKKNIYYLRAKESLLIDLHFKPTESGNWSVAIPIYKYITCNEVYVYNYLQLFGICYESTLHSEVHEIFFPPVPLKTKLTREIILVASYQKYDTNISVSFKNDLSEKITYVHPAIKVTFPNSSFVQRNKSLISIPVLVTFQSEHPFSSKVTIFFSDTDEGMCHVHLYATAAVSLLTTHCYHFLSHDCFFIKETDTRSSQGNIVVKSVSSDSLSSNRTEENKDISLRDPRISLSSAQSSTSSFSSHQQSIMSFDESTWFPEFPPSCVTSPYTSFMNRLVKYINKWILFRGLKGVYQLKVGEDLTLSNAYSKFLGSQPMRCQINSVIDLVVHLFGSQISERYSLSNNAVLQGEMSRVLHTLLIFNRILNFLRDKGNFLAHLIPVYFLSYDDFVELFTYERKMKSLEHTKDFESPPLEAVFERISKQVWLDFYFQIYKTHTIDKEISQTCDKFICRFELCAKSEESIKGSKIVTQSQVSFGKLKHETKSVGEFVSTSLISKIEGNFSHGEKVLLVWLTMSFNKGAHLFNVPELEFPLGNFRSSLMDGTVLAVVTAHYCPFLISKYLNRINFNPSTPVEMQHNANCLIDAWDKLVHGVVISSWDLLTADTTFLIMLVAHLYLTFPTYLPSFSLSYKASLGTSLKQGLLIHNPSNEVIKCCLKLFQEKDVFSIATNNDKFQLGPKANRTIFFNFNAKYTQKCTGIVLLKGSTDNSDIYGKTTSVLLTGEIDKMTISNRFSIHLPIYKLTYLNLKLFAPYKKSCDYTVTISAVRPTPEAGFEKPLRSNEKCRIPQELYVSSNKIFVKDEGFFLPVAACCYSMGIKHFWLLFSNELVGEFIAQVSLNPYSTLPTSVLNVKFFIHRNEINAMKKVNIPVPSMNEAMWKAASSVINLSNNKSDSFWISYLAYPFGTKLLQYGAINNCPTAAHFIDHFSKRKVVYNLQWTSTLVFGPAQVVFEDIHSLTPTNIKLNIDKSVTESFSMLLSLISEDKKEVRTYKVNFNPIYTEKEPRKDVD